MPPAAPEIDGYRPGALGRVVALHDAARGTGIGRRLMQEAMDFARAA